MLTALQIYPGKLLIEGERTPFSKAKLESEIIDTLLSDYSLKQENVSTIIALFYTPVRVISSELVNGPKSYIFALFSGLRLTPV
jgi:hypothetical protein